MWSLWETELAVKIAVTGQEEQQEQEVAEEE
jgi:hypothetical protein